MSCLMRGRSTSSSAGGAFSLGDNSETVGAVTVAGGNASVNNGTLTVGTIGVTAGKPGDHGQRRDRRQHHEFFRQHRDSVARSGSLTATTLNLSNSATLTPGGSLSVTTVNVDNATIAAGPLAATAINVTSSGNHRGERQRASQR
jgi:hypothetical protein